MACLALFSSTTFPRTLSIVVTDMFKAFMLPGSNDQFFLLLDHFLIKLTTSGKVLPITESEYHHPFTLPSRKTHFYIATSEGNYGRNRRLSDAVIFISRSPFMLHKRH